MLDKETIIRFKDDAWCDGFIEAWNAQACANAGIAETVEQLEEKLDETIKALVKMTESFDMLAGMMRRERLDG